MSGGSAPQRRFLGFPAFRLHAKMMLGFLVVLAVSAASLGIAYLGFERIAQAVVSYRNSVSEADLARNIDRELISYRAVVNYYVVTGKEDDAKAALSAEASLKGAIDQALKGTRKPARREGLDRLAGEFKKFAATFAEILKLKRDSALVTQNQLMRNANMLRYKLDDIASNAAESELPAVEIPTGNQPSLRAKRSNPGPQWKAGLLRFARNDDPSTAAVERWIPGSALRANPE